MALLPARFKGTIKRRKENRVYIRKRITDIYLTIDKLKLKGVRGYDVRVACVRECVQEASDEERPGGRIDRSLLDSISVFFPSTLRIRQSFPANFSPWYFACVKCEKRLNGCRWIQAGFEVKHEIPRRQSFAMC